MPDPPLLDPRSTPVLDNFNREPENPLTGTPESNTLWGRLSTIGAPSYVNKELQLSSTDMWGYWDGSASANFPYSGANNGIDYSAWMMDVYDNDCEVWGYPVGGEAGAALTGWRMGFMMADHVPGTMYGYNFIRATALGDFMIWRRYDGGGSYTALEKWPGIVTEDYSPLLYAKREGIMVEAWTCDTHDGLGTWQMITKSADSTYTGPFRLFIGTEDPTTAGTGWAGMGGGNMGGGGGGTWMPQIIRPWDDKPTRRY